MECESPPGGPGAAESRVTQRALGADGAALGADGATVKRLSRKTCQRTAGPPWSRGKGAGWAGDGAVKALCMSTPEICGQKRQGSVTMETKRPTVWIQIAKPDLRPKL